MPQPSEHTLLSTPVGSKKWKRKAAESRAQKKISAKRIKNVSEVRSNNDNNNDSDYKQVKDNLYF